ncbi:hypothetical protein Tco_1532846 [Tanacetum coccineum]
MLPFTKRFLVAPYRLATGERPLSNGCSPFGLEQLGIRQLSVDNFASGLSILPSKGAYLLFPYQLFNLSSEDSALRATSVVIAFATLLMPLPFCHASPEYYIVAMGNIVRRNGDYELHDVHLHVLSGVRNIKVNVITLRMVKRRKEGKQGKELKTQRSFFRMGFRSDRPKLDNFLNRSAMSQALKDGNNKKGKGNKGKKLKTSKGLLRTVMINHQDNLLTNGFTESKCNLVE